MSKIIVGIDISKVTFDVALLTKEKTTTKKFDNNSDGFDLLLKWLSENDIIKSDISDIHFCMESTGNYSNELAIFLYDRKYLISVVNPAQIKYFANSELARTKTDKYDCKLIARFCKTMNPKAWHPAPIHIRELRSLIGRLKDLQQLQQQEINRSYVALPVIKDSIDNTINYLNNEIKQIEKRISDLIKQSPDLKDKAILLGTIPGIGNATIMKILAFFSNIGDFKSAKQLVAFVGLNPKQRQSGTSLNGKGHISKLGNKELRQSLYMPVIVAKNHNPIIKQFCMRLELTKKPKMVIVVAAMRKLLHIVYGVLKTSKPFDASLAIV